MNYESMLSELRKQQENVETILSNPVVKVRLSSEEVVNVSNPVQLRKTILTLQHRENREKRENKERLDQLKTYFQNQQLLSEELDTTQYEIPHSDDFADMLEEHEYV